MTQLSKTLQVGAIFPIRHVPPQAIAFIMTSLLVFLSIVLYMMDTTSEQVGTMLARQNAASLKLWSNLDYFERHPSTNDASMPPGLFDDLVEFARTNENIIRTAKRLFRSDIVKAQKAWIDPNIKSTEVVREGRSQIQLYQKIREDAQRKVTVQKSYVAAFSIYILPCLYALLGAFLYTCRTRPHRKIEGHGSRYAMAFILGATISVFGAIIPKDVVLSPLAIAFLAGYSIDAFTSRLDVLVENLKHPTARAQIGQPA